jgi:hypothetical protein
MANPQPTEIWQFRTLCYLGDQTSINVRHVTIVSSITGGCTDVELAAYLDGRMSPLYRALLANGAVYRGVATVRAFPAPVDVEAVSTAGFGIGTAGATSLPPQTAGLLALKGSLIGHRFLGRLYAPFPATADTMADGNPAAGYATRLNALGTEFLSARTVVGTTGSTTFNYVIYSRVAGVATYIAQKNAANRWATQRRRSAINRGDNLPF